MTLKERKIYISGKRNPNGYIINPFDYFNNRRRAKIICIILVVGLIIDALCLFGITSWRNIFSFTGIADSVKQQDSNFVVYYLDAGQSDCSIVICDDEVLMIDSGTVNQVNNIRTNLSMLEIDTIDYLLITHQHDDHMGGAAEIINHYSVSNILMPKLSEDNAVISMTYDNLINAISENKVTPISISYGDSFMLGSALVEIFSPMKQYDNINNMSVVTKITYENTSFLFTGDSEKEIEKQLLRVGADISADVLKVGHHGSNTSSTDNFLSAVNPDYAIISSGFDNSFGHPNDNVIERFEKIGIIPYITSINGHITVTSDGNKVTVIPEEVSIS